MSTSSSSPRSPRRWTWLPVCTLLAVLCLPVSGSAQQAAAAGASAAGSGPVQADILNRDAEPLFASGFYTRLDAVDPPSMTLTLQELLAAAAGSLQTHGWIPVLQLVVTLLVGGVFRHRARQKAALSPEWAFLFRHPWSAGLFVALVFGGLFLVSPVPLWRWAQIVLGTLSATILITAMLDRPRLRRLIMVLATLLVITETLRTLGLPQPWSRLYLVVVCLVATPLCLGAAKRQVRRQQGRIDLLAVLFFCGTLIGLVGLVSQVFGFARLSALLIDAALGTVFVGLFARMALHLSEGALSTFLRTDWVKQRQLVRQLGRLLEQRIKTVLRLLVYAYTLLSLLVLWQVFPSIEQAWSRVTGFSLQYGELSLSVETVFLVVFILYLTMIASWVLQAVLETQILSVRGMDLGVRDSIKRLTHYALVLFGLLTALGLAGIEMEKFALLAGAMGVGIGFGLQNIVNNFVSGLILLFERPVKVGDTINIDDEWGTITRIGLRSTIFETLDRSEIIVPNSELISQKVTNWTYSSNVSRILVQVGVAYGSPLDKVLDILLRVAKEHSEVLVDPPASAIFTGFGNNSIDFELRVWIADIGKRLQVKSELGQAIDRYFRDEGIVIPFPQRDLHLRSIEPNLQGLFNPASTVVATDRQGSTP